MPRDLASIVDDVSIETPWKLVKAFAAQERERPEDANAGADLIARALSDHGIPV